MVGIEEPGARERIIKASIELLEEEKDASKITVRRIAERAGVGIGLINYHFRSKDNLISEAVAGEMAGMAEHWRETTGQTGVEPVEKLKMMIKDLSGFAVQRYKYTKISVAHEIMHGEMDVPLYLLPVLREIYGGTKDERELRLISLQLIVVLQVILLRPATFKRYAGIDIFDDKQRDEGIEIIINNIVR